MTDASGLIFVSSRRGGPVFVVPTTHRDEMTRRDQFPTSVFGLSVDGGVGCALDARRMEHSRDRLRRQFAEQPPVVKGEFACVPESPATGDVRNGLPVGG